MAFSRSSTSARKLPSHTGAGGREPCFRAAKTVTGIATGPSPVDRGRAGSKHHLITDGHGTPLAVLLTGGNRNDVTQLLPLLEAVPPVRGRVGRPRGKPDRCSLTGLRP